MDRLSAIMNRRSVRRYRDEPLDKATAIALLEILLTNPFSSERTGL